MIQGQMEYRLLSGMRHVLANNFVYKNRAPMSKIVGDAILPLDFAISWKNIKIFHTWDDDVTKDNSAFGEEFQNCRLVMEESSGKNNGMGLANYYFCF